MEGFVTKATGWQTVNKLQMSYAFDATSTND